MPPHFLQKLAVALIAGDVACAFGFPEFSVCSGFYRAVTAVVAVPEATVHKDDSIVSPEHQIGAAREVGLMKSKAVAKSVYEAAHDHLGAGVLRANAGHISGPLLWSMYIGHASETPLSGRVNREFRKHPHCPALASGNEPLGMELRGRQSEALYSTTETFLNKCLQAPDL